MKRSDLKRLMKPLIRECIHEVLVDEGILAKVVSEVAKGMGNVIVENRQPEPKPSPAPRAAAQETHNHQKKKLQETRDKLTKSIGSKAYSGIFEVITPGPAPSRSQSGALKDIAPDDPGVDISGIVALGGKKWKPLAQGVKE